MKNLKALLIGTLAMDIDFQLAVDTLARKNLKKQNKPASEKNIIMEYQRIYDLFVNAIRDIKEE